MTPRTLVEKIWSDHVVTIENGGTDVLYIDLQLIHEVTSPQAFAFLRDRGLRVRRPERTFATVDHVIPTQGAIPARTDSPQGEMIAALQANATKAGISLWGTQHPNRGIVHVTAPEQGLVRPGMTVVCGDSHTSTLGAFGALAFGIGSSEVAHVLATQTLTARRPKTLEVRISGAFSLGVTAKDIALEVVRALGTNGAIGHAIEYTGPVVQALDMEARMTICNMAVEAGARTGVIGPDEETVRYLEERPRPGESETAPIDHAKLFATDAGARFDASATVPIHQLEPMVSYGTTPAMAAPITAEIPGAPGPAIGRTLYLNALDYMGLKPGTPLQGLPIDVVFIGSCTNARISDLRAAANILQGQKIHPGVRMLVVPGSEAVRAQAETEGLHEIFGRAGAEWRRPGCSMCIAMNGDRLQPGEYAVSTSNRNFEGRQGPGGRTFLASPLTAAASAINGHLSDPRDHL